MIGRGISCTCAGFADARRGGIIFAIQQSKTILAGFCKAHRGNYADEVPGATALGCRDDELRDLFAAVRA
jgi:hypothetical protein